LFLAKILHTRILQKRQLVVIMR